MFKRFCFSCVSFVSCTHTRTHTHTNANSLTQTHAREPASKIYTLPGADVAWKQHAAPVILHATDIMYNVRRLVGLDDPTHELQVLTFVAQVLELHLNEAFARVSVVCRTAAPLSFRQQFALAWGQRWHEQALSSECVLREALQQGHANSQVFQSCADTRVLFGAWMARATDIHSLFVGLLSEPRSSGQVA